MTNRRSRESTNPIMSLIDPENAEQLKRTRTDIENNITKILKLVKNESQTKKDGNPRRSKKAEELIGLTDDLSKQYQSLYALYDGVIEKLIYGIKNTKASVSTTPDPDPVSEEEEEYFSSEEVEANRRKSADKELQRISDIIKKEADTAAAKELFQGQITSLMEQVGNLNQKKNNLQLEVESQENEVKQLSVKKSELEDQVMKLELLREKQDVVTELEEKLKKCEEQANSNIEKLLAQVNELQLETKSLQAQKDEMEEKVKFDRNEASTQIENMMEQLNTMQQKLNSLQAEMVKKGEQVSQYVIEIENMKQNLAETEKTLKEEKEVSLARIKELELELETQINKLQDQLGDSNYENKQLMNENKALQDRNHELKAAMTEKGEEISDFLKENESNNKNSTYMENMALKAEVNGMRLELDTLYEQKTKLEIQNERNQKEYAETIAKMENLATQISDQEKSIKNHVETIDRINAASNKYRISQRWAERKMEELGEEIRKKMEDNIRLLHQRIHVAEQLNNENKNSCKLTRLRYEEENKTLREKVGIYEGGDAATSSSLDLKRIEFEGGLNGLDIAVEKVGECILNSVSKMVSEVEIAKDWVKKRNEEMREMKEKLSEKEERELLLRDRVWNLEAEVSKGGGENLNLRKAVSKLEKKVGSLEKNVKEKDEELISLGEKKREAIRQLCIVADFHRERCNYLRSLVPNTKVSNKKKKRTSTT